MDRSLKDSKESFLRDLANQVYAGVIQGPSDPPRKNSPRPLNVQEEDKLAGDKMRRERKRKEEEALAKQTKTNPQETGKAARTPRGTNSWRQ